MIYFRNTILIINKINVSISDYSNKYVSKPKFSQYRLCVDFVRILLYPEARMDISYACQGDPRKKFHFAKIPTLVAVEQPDPVHRCLLGGIGTRPLRLPPTIGAAAIR